MSHHLLHVFTHGAFLSKEKGVLLMKSPQEKEIRQMPLEDIRGLILAARGICLSNDLIRGLGEAQAVILHCDSRYRPAAVTVPLTQTTRPEIIENQANRSLKLHERLWQRILRNKVRNQMQNLRRLGRLSDDLWEEVCKPGFRPEESLWARRYWREFFSLMGKPDEIRDQEGRTPLNAMLNYGYAVLQSLVHRAIVIHGMIPNLGFHHATRYRADPLVYDLMEPLRAFVDAMLRDFCQKNEPQTETLPLWARHVASSLAELRVKTPVRGRLRLLHALDEWVSSVARCLEYKSITHYWEITLDQKSLQNGLDHGDV